MGLGNCCKNSPKEEEARIIEMKDGIIPNLGINQEENNKDLTISYNLNQNYKIESKDSEFLNLSQQKSEEIFNLFNNIRNKPQNYISEAKKYNLYRTISSANQRASKGIVNNLIKNPFFDLFFDKCVKASPESKEDILNNIEKEKLFKNYEKNLFIEEGNNEIPGECVWNLIKNCENIGVDILGKEVDYLVITTVSLDDKNGFLGYFLFLSKFKENSGIIE